MDMQVLMCLLLLFLDREDKSGSDSGSQSSEDKKPKAVPAKDGNAPHRKPKNFAERLMKVLREEISQDTIWWIGDGKAVAIHTKNLKQGNLLTEHFKVKDYTVFIRNCNRW